MHGRARKPAFFRGNLVTEPLEPCFFPITVQTGLRKSDLLITLSPSPFLIKVYFNGTSTLLGRSAPLISVLAANDTTYLLLENFYELREKIEMYIMCHLGYDIHFFFNSDH